MSKLTRLLSVGAFATLLLAPVGPVANAQSDRENSTFTVTEPFDVGNVTLQPGTYLIKVSLLSSNRNVVQVTNVDQTKVFATVLATPHRIKADETIPASRYTYYPAVGNRPKALRTWFARDTPNGQDIVYTNRRAMEIAAVTHEPMTSIADDTTETEFPTADFVPVTASDPAVSKLDEPAPAPIQTAQLEEKLPRKLPTTGSDVPLAASLGVLSLGLALALRARSQSA